MGLTFLPFVLVIGQGLEKFQNPYSTLKGSLANERVHLEQSYTFLTLTYLTYGIVAIEMSNLTLMQSWRL